ncbi:MAG TPA: ATP synthase F0 subunit C [Gemmataceae bacterium]
MKAIVYVLTALTVVLLAASPAAAQEPAAATPVAVPNTGAGIGMGLAVIGIGIGLGVIGFSALSGMARQPEQAGRLQGTMLLMAALVEGAGIITIILCFVLALL